jgi:hypothetical protein
MGSVLEYEPCICSHTVHNIKTEWQDPARWLSCLKNDRNSKFTYPLTVRTSYKAEHLRCHWGCGVNEACEAA